MQSFESDSTYCSQAEKITNRPTSRARKADRSLFRNVRRSQRLLQQSKKNKTTLNWANIRYKMAQRSPYARKMRLRRRSQSSAHFRHSTESDVCSQPVDLSKAASVRPSSAKTLGLSSIKIKQSVDLMADFETQTFTSQIPMNQKHLLDTLPQTSNQTTKDAAQSIDLTQSASNAILKKSTKGRPRKKDAAGVIDLTNDGAKLAAGDAPINSELRKPLETDADSPSVAENNFKLKPKVELENNGHKIKKTKSRVQQSNKDKQIKNKRKMCAPAQTKTKFQNDMITKYLNLADFIEDSETDKRKKRFQLHPSCPTSSGSYKPISPIPIKPVPLLRSVANSVLPKVYPSHFIHQKSPIKVNDSIPYEKTHIREMQAFRRTRLTQNIPPQRSPIDTTNPLVTMLCPDASPIETKAYEPHVIKESITPEKNYVTNCLTPELTQSSTPDRDITTSTSPSLPESLKGIFDSDDLRQILNVDRIEYRLCDNHVKALAIVLNIRVENLREVLKNIVKLDQQVLKKIESAMKTTSKEPSEKDKQDAGCFVRSLMSPVLGAENSQNTNPRRSSFPNRRQHM